MRFVDMLKKYTPYVRAYAAKRTKRNGLINYHLLLFDGDGPSESVLSLDGLYEHESTAASGTRADDLAKAATSWYMHRPGEVPAVAVPLLRDDAPVDVPVDSPVDSPVDVPADVDGPGIGSTFSGCIAVVVCGCSNGTSSVDANGGAACSSMGESSPTDAADRSKIGRMSSIRKGRSFARIARSSFSAAPRR